MKQTIDMRDFAQPYGLLVWWPREPPDPTKIVFPSTYYKLGGEGQTKKACIIIDER